MSSIDKTYIDGKEYPLYRQWWIDNYDKMIRELGDTIWLYPFNWFDLNNDVEITPDYLKSHNEDMRVANRYTYDYPIWNTSERIDKWLVKNCPIQSFRDRMINVYPSNWNGFKGCKWVPKKNNKPKCIK